MSGQLAVYGIPHTTTTRLPDRTLRMLPMCRGRDAVGDPIGLLCADGASDELPDAMPLAGSGPGDGR